uniref:Cyclin domain-containing protein n=1 Tax=Colletotrichum fructicola (strain Nara gc5) TaxID=1213859 RepID=L2FDH1_COLFN
MAHMTNPLATAEQLYKRNTFSSLPADLQDVIFYATQILTQAAGVLLDLPQANVLLARYWLVESPMAQEFSDISAAAIYLVSKIGPLPRSTRDLSNALDFLGKPKAEVAGRVIAHLNTALLSPQMLYLTHQPNALATAAVYIAARDVGAKMPEVAWWEVFDVEREELGFLVVGFRSLEGWVRSVKETGLLSAGMITRSVIEREARRRAGEGDEEDEVMRLMDQKTA